MYNAKNRATSLISRILASDNIAFISTVAVFLTLVLHYVLTLLITLAIFTLLQYDWNINIATAIFFIGELFNVFTNTNIHVEFSK